MRMNRLRRADLPKFTLHDAPLLASAEHILDLPGEARWYRPMPKLDQRDLVFLHNTNRTQGDLVVVAHIADPGKVCALESGDVITRDQVSQVLKAGAEDAGIPGAMVASHSLRRGGSVAYAASGLSEANLMKFGRWKSMAYKAYVYQHAEAMKEVLHKASKFVPRMEKN